MGKNTKEEDELLANAAREISLKYTRALLPEEEKLFDDKLGLDGINMQGPGYHIHSEPNPLGEHRHSIDDEIDGAHRHTMLNKMGEHAHGVLDGMALMDGKHSHHYTWDLGYHHHSCDDMKDDGGKDIEDVPSVV